MTTDKYPTSLGFDGMVLEAIAVIVTYKDESFHRVKDKDSDIHWIRTAGLDRSGSGFGTIIRSDTDLYKELEKHYEKLSFTL